MIALGLFLMLAGTAAWILLPLWSSMGAMPQEPAPAEELRERHRQLLLGLQDLDFEMQTGKLSPDDHASMRGRLQGEAIAVLKRLDGQDNAGSEDSEE
jgi:hypothetical protein